MAGCFRIESRFCMVLDTFNLALMCRGLVQSPKGLNHRSLTPFFPYLTLYKERWRPPKASRGDPQRLAFLLSS